MKKSLVVVVMLIAVLCIFSVLKAIDVPTIGTESTTPYGRWRTVATFASASGDPSDLAVTKRTYLTVSAAITTAANDDDKIIIKQLKYGVNALRFRLAGLTENASVVLQLYSGALDGYPDCELVKYGTLTFTIGTQGSITSLFEMADTLIITNDATSVSNWVVTSPANNTCAEAYFDFVGDDTLVIVPTTIDCNAQLYMKGI